MQAPPFVAVELSPRCYQPEGLQWHLTLPSSGQPKPCCAAFSPPLMSNVRHPLRGGRLLFLNPVVAFVLFGFVWAVAVYFLARFVRKVLARRAIGSRSHISAKEK